MKHPVSVSSSHLESLHYNSHNQYLDITFKNGSTYRYHGVTPQEFDALHNAKSHGEHFISHIKDKHRFEKV